MEYIATGVVVVVIVVLIGAMFFSKKTKAPLDPKVKKAAITTFINFK